jgi:eukaryotic-like serine/threonine-protein kinase
VQRGEVIAGRFEIEALAGTGGMADVYRALDLTSGTPVALKILKANAPEDLARLAREAQALTRLAHPGIVHYVAHGTAETSDAFVAMEWVEGVTLSKRLRAGPLALGETLELGRALASALAHAHEHGVVHRDVKPGNVVLRNNDVADPMLLDFGVAKTGLAVGLTQMGTVIGTPRYMAPEQARGGQAVDSRADVFALGAVMFKCFTGRAPFDGDDAIAVLAHLLFDDAPDVCALVPGVPRAVGDMLLKMLAKEPVDRYPDGAAVVRAIDALDVSSMPVSVPVHAPGLTLRERRLLSLMVLTGKADANVARRVADGFGGRAEPLADGTVVVFVSGRDNATELARVSARCALELRRALPEAPIVLATGRGDDVGLDDDDAMSQDRTIASEATGTNASSSRYSGVFERAAGLMRLDVTGAQQGIVIDDTTAGLLGADFDIARTIGSSVHALRGPSIRKQYTLLGKPTPFVGRARELAALLATWDDVCEQGVPRAVLVVGDAGLGKSRLLYETLEALKSHEAPVLRLRAKADATTAGSPFAAIGAAIRRELGIGDDEPATERWSKLAARVASVVAEGESHVAEFIAEIAGVRLAQVSEQVAAARRDPRLMADRIRRAWRAWIKGEASRGPVLIVLEDAHWGDLPTVKLVDEMFHDLAEAPVFVLTLARPEVDTTFPGMWSRVVERMPLSALSKKAATTFASSMIADGAAVERIVGLASGNALHLEELVRAAAEGRTDAPESLLAMLSAQVEVLPDAERRVLRAASIFGTSFPAAGVVVLLGGTLVPGDRLEAEVRSLLDGLVRHEMVSARDGDHQFRNGLVRDVTYQMLTDDDRRRGHGLAADWLERTGNADPFVLAEHRERARQLEPAIAAYLRSASVAVDASDFGVALARIARAKACGASGESLARLHILEAEAHRWRGETRECAVVAAQAAENTTPGSATYYRAIQHIVYASSYGGDIEGLRRTATSLLEASPSDDVLTEWARAVKQAANGLIVTGHVRENDALVARLEAMPANVVAGNAELHEALLTAKGYRAYGKGDFVGMVEVNHASARMRRELGDERGYLVALSNEAFALMWLGRFGEAHAAYTEVRAIAAPLALLTLEINAIQNVAYMQLCVGDVDGAIRGSRAVLARSAVEAPRLVALAHLCIARAMIGGDVAEAGREARLGIETAPTDVVRMYAHAILAEVLLAGGRVDEAKVSSSEALDLLRKLGTLAVGDLYAHVIRAEVLAASGDVAAARETVERATAMFESRRTFVHDDDGRAMFDARSPDAQRLMATRARLLERS